MWDAMAPPERRSWLRDGVLHVPSQYGEPTPITRALIEDGRNHLVLSGAIPLAARCGCCTASATRTCRGNWRWTRARGWTRADVRVTLIKDGDHRLSRPADLDLLRQTVGALLVGDGA